MKILHVIDSGGLYGAEAVLMLCVEEQIKLGCEPVIASIGEEGVEDKPLEIEAERRGLPYVRIRMKRGLNPAGGYRIYAYAKSNNFDVIHSHGYKGNILLGLMPRSLRKLPVVATVHGWTNVRRISRMAVYQWLDRWALCFIDCVILVSEAMLSRDFSSKYKNVVVVRNGISFDEIHRNTNDAMSKHEELRIGAVGRLSNEKGFDLLIEAFRQVRASGIKAQLTIVGEGRERKNLEAQIHESGLDGCVSLPGFKDNIKEYLDEVDIFVLSSLTEGAPISVLEALRSRTPVIATNVGGVPEILDNGRAGILVDPGNAHQLSAAIIAMHANPEDAKRRVSNGYDRAIRLYNSRVMAQEYCRLYEKV